MVKKIVKKLTYIYIYIQHTHNFKTQKTGEISGLHYNMTTTDNQNK